MSARAGAQRGFALVLVLWVGALLAIVVGTLAFGVRSEVAVTRGGVELAQAEALAEAGVTRAVVGLLERDRVMKWRADGAPYSVTLGSGAVTVRVVSERGKIDLNAAPEEVIRGLFEVAAGKLEGLDPEDAKGIAAAVLDWRDTDGAPRPGGAEAGAYAAAGLPWSPANAAFVTVSELRRVRGVTSELYAAVAPELTVNGVGARLDPQSASALALEALPGADAGRVEEFMAARDEWAGGGGVAEGGVSFPSQALVGLERYLARGASAFYTVTADARTNGGRRARCVALVRLTGRPARPAEILAWDTSGAHRPLEPPEPALDEVGQ